MAGQRRSPLEDPPSSSSHEEEDEVESDEEEVEEEDSLKKQQEKSSDDDEEEDGEEESEEEEAEAEPTPLVSSQKKPTPKAPQPQPSDSEESDGSDSDDDSDSLRSLKSPAASDFIIKPNASKSTDSAVKSHQKASGKPAAVLAPSSKQAVKSGKEPVKKEKTSMAADADESNKTTASEKKPGVARLWSEPDELALLKGMIEFESKKGTDPMSDPHQFCEFIKKPKSLHLDVSERQIIDKIKRLKKKCIDNIGKFSNGEDPIFARSHDYKIFDLSKKIWKGDNAKSKSSKKSAAPPPNGDANPTDSKSASKKSKEKKNVPMVVALPNDGGKSNNTVLKENLVSNGASSKEEDVKMVDTEVKQRKRGISEMYPYIHDTMQSMDGMNFLKGVDLSMIDKSKMEDLELKFKKHKLAETELYLEKMEGVKEMCKLMITSMK